MIPRASVAHYLTCWQRTASWARKFRLSTKICAIAGRPIRIHDALPFTHPFNLSGHPALALPAGFTDAGLPASVQLVARRFREDVLLRLGRQLEQARPWPLMPGAYRP